MSPPPFGDGEPVSLEELYATTFHELRAPLSSINGYSSLLLTGELGELNPRQREPLERIQEICRSLTATIGNLLTLAKAGASRIQPVREFVDVAGVAREAIRSLQGELRRKNLRLVQKIPAQPVRFWGDPNDLHQILLNLLSNAAKFTAPKGQLRVKVSMEGGAVALEVADTGVGIPAEDLPRIFEEFYHVDHPETGATSGSGLGLAIVKRTVEAYRGQIKVNSRVGRGTSFHILFPSRPEEKILEEFFEESWARAKQEGQGIGLVLLQVKPPSGSPGRRPSAAAGKFLDFLEATLRDQLRREDRIFHLPGQFLLAVVVRVDREGFSMFVQRLERAFRDAAARPVGGQKWSIPWRMVTLLAPQRGSAAQVLALAERRLSQAWKDKIQAKGE